MTTLGPSSCAQVAIYSMSGNCECLACNHPVSRILPTEELRDILLSFITDEINEWFDRYDVDLRERAAIEEYLHHPHCGGVGQALLAKLGREGQTDWAVGFVSVAAGMLLASVVIQSILQGGSQTRDMGSEFFAWFLRPGLGRSWAVRKLLCDICASEDKQERFKGLLGTFAT
jgi:hypothetical protein